MLKESRASRVQKCSEPCSDLQGEIELAAKYLDSSGAVLVITNPNHIALYVSSEACNALECRQENIIGKRWPDDSHIQRIYRDGNLQSEYHPWSTAESSISNYETSIPTKDGGNRAIAWFSRPMTDMYQHVVCLFHLGQDITEAKKIQNSLKERYKELHLFYFISEAADRGTTDIDKFCGEVVGAIPKAFQYPANACARITINDAEYETDNWEKTKWRLSSAINVKGSKVGDIDICYLSDKLGGYEKVCCFLEEEKQMLDAVGERLGKVVERITTRTELRRLETRYRMLFENARDGIIVHDNEGKIVMANDAMEGISGYSVEELNQKQILDLFPQADNQSNLQREARLTEKEKAISCRRCEFEIARRDGDRGTVEIVSSPIVDAGQPANILSIVRDITEQKRVRENIRIYAQQVTLAQEEERKRIARELHDETTQLLMSLAMDIDTIIRNKDHSSEDIWESLEGLRDRSEIALDGVRRLSQDLRPIVLEQLGLARGLRHLMNELSKGNGIGARFELLGKVRRIEKDDELTVFRIAQEALSNIRRHSRATEAVLRLEFTRNKVILRIRDNGVGFEIPESIGDFASAGKLGLIGIRERAELLGGTWKIKSRLGEGTSLSIEVHR